MRNKNVALLVVGYVLSFLFSGSAFAAEGDVLASLRFQSVTAENECIGGSGTDSKVGLWDCAADTERYDWEIIETSNPQVFYIRNVAKKNRCLMSKSDGNYLRYYEGTGGQCRLILLARWRILNEAGDILNIDDIRNGIQGTEVRLSNDSNGRCVSDEGGKGRLRSCNGLANQLFNVNPPGATSCWQVEVGERAVYSGYAYCVDRGRLLEGHISSQYEPEVTFQEIEWDSWPGGPGGYTVYRCSADVPFERHEPVYNYYCD